jgi:NitT/TauT family transport system substrate-binding protein
MSPKLLAGKRRLPLMIAGLVAAVGLSACASPPGERASGAESRGYRFAGVFCVCFANAYVAWKEGFFEKEGVPVDDFVMTAGGADTFAALAGGDADFGLSGLDAIMRGIEKKIDVRAVATVSPEFYQLTVRQQEAGNINSVADLKGKKVSVSKVGSASWAFLKLLLEEKGMKESDVQIVPLGSIDTTMIGLKAGKVDAAVTWEPGSSQGATDGSAKVLLSALVPADHQAIYGLDSSISMTLGVTRGLIDSNPKVVHGAVRALDRANEWMHEHSAAQVADVIAPLAKGLDRDILVRAVEHTMATMPQSVAVSNQAYLASADRLKAAGIVEAVPAIEAVFDCKVGECVK